MLAFFVGGFTKTLPTVIYTTVATSFDPSVSALGVMVTVFSASCCASPRGCCDRRLPRLIHTMPARGAGTRVAGSDQSLWRPSRRLQRVTGREPLVSSSRSSARADAVSPPFSKMVIGAVQPTSGQVVLRGQDVATLPPRKARCHHGMAVGGAVPAHDGGRECRLRSGDAQTAGACNCRSRGALP